MKTARPFLQIGRSALLLFSTVLNLFALRWLQLDEALSILFATPFLVALLSVPMLGETVGWRRWTAIGVGFFGVLVVTRPGFGGMHPAAFLSMSGAVCYAFYVISTRVLSRTDSQRDHAVLHQLGRRARHDARCCLSSGRSRTAFSSRD